jgi:RNA-directed DNA polymerase
MAHKTLLELTSEEVRKVLLKNESYVNFDLPNYFDFEDLLQQVSALLTSKNWTEFVTTNADGDKKWPGYEFDVNHKIIVNKNSNLSWRPLELTHPILYEIRVGPRNE